MAIWAAVVSFAGGLQARQDLISSGARAIYAALFMVALASLGLWTALMARDFSIGHVAAFTSANLPRLYTLAAFWAGPAGSLLLWALALAACAAVVVRINERGGAANPFATGTLGITLAFAIAALCLAENPYSRIEWVPLDGRGMLPLLQQPGMLLHPPILLLGLAATAVPLALTVSSLLRRNTDPDGVETMRRWIAVSWLFLTAGMLLGMWWAYGETGWSDAWTREPIEGAAVFPWAMNTILLHSLGARGARARLQRVNALLVMLAFLLAGYSALAADGGIMSSAHSNSVSSVRGWTIVFLILSAAALGYLLVTRLASLDAIDRGIFPTGSRGALGTAARLPLRIIYAGFIVLAAAVGGQQLTREYEVTLAAGESRELLDPFGQAWRFSGQGVSQYRELNRGVVAAPVEVSRGKRSVGIVNAEQRQYMNSRGEPTSAPWLETATLSGIAQDVQITALEFADDERVRVRIAFRPFVIWVWIGGLIMLIGGGLALAPRARSDA